MIQRPKKIFVCSKCDAQFPKWLGQCSECGGWGTISEQVVAQNEKEEIKIAAGKIIEFSQIKAENYPRLRTGIEELDRVLGGGVVPGSLVLLGGEPGSGKSTLMAQIADRIVNCPPEADPPSADKLSAFAKSYGGFTEEGKIENSVLYVSGEESAGQIKMRMDRLKISDKKIQYLGETDINVIGATIEKYQPALAIIDSIQTMSDSGLPGSPGSINQVRVCTGKLLSMAKQTGIPVFITGHITKEGLVAGPKTLEHLVDTVLYLEGDLYHHFRILRAAKNRFGATNEVGVFEMTENGLTEVKNPSEIFLSQKETNISGSVVSAVLKGTRPFLVEVQALVAKTFYGYPQRRAIGIDFNRLGLLVAVLSLRCGLPLSSFDIHLNLVGGMEVEEPAIDLAVCLAIVSALRNKIIDPRLVAFGEVGLGGEIRPVGFIKERIKEASKLGFKKIILPVCREKIEASGVKLIEVSNLNQAIKELSI